MATRLTRNVTRVVPTRRDGDLVVTLTNEGVMVREKGRRTTYGPIPYGKLLIAGARDFVAAQKAAKVAARQAARAARQAAR